MAYINQQLQNKELSISQEKLLSGMLTGLAYAITFTSDLAKRKSK